MNSVINMTIRNKFVYENRDLNVYHHREKKANLIGVSGAVTALLSSAREGDYLHISIVSGPGNLKFGNVVNLPTWVDFELYTERRVTVSHVKDRIEVRIPEGTPPWQMRVTHSQIHPPPHSADYIAVGDEFTDRH